MLFFMGASFAHYVVTPLAMNFFIGFADAIPILTSYILGNEPPAVSESTTELRRSSWARSANPPTWRSSSSSPSASAFQLPVLLTLLGKAGLVSAEGLGNVRKWAVVGILTLAALITPPDVITQMILFTVVYGLYEISIQLVRW
jgi:sec-independent protein translocase protein TatC